MSELVILLVKIIGSILCGIIAGHGAVYVFNKIPAKWLCDYGEEPSQELKDPYISRIKGYPWKLVFSGFFVAGSIYLSARDWQFALAALPFCWSLLVIALADKKYMIIPDQFVILTAISAMGFIPYHMSFLQPLWGGLLGIGLMLLCALAGRLLFKKESLGFGDVKLMGAMGLAMGTYGIVLVFILSAFISSVIFTAGLLRKTLKKDDMKPLAPYLCAAAIIYVVIIWPLL